VKSLPSSTSDATSTSSSTAGIRGGSNKEADRMVTRAVYVWEQLPGEIHTRQQPRHVWQQWPHSRLDELLRPSNLVACI
jgi:hypothetical protein